LNPARWSRCPQRQSDKKSDYQVRIVLVLWCVADSVVETAARCCVVEINRREGFHDERLLLADDLVERQVAAATTGAVGGG